MGLIGIDPFHRYIHLNCEHLNLKSALLSNSMNWD